MDLRLLDGLYGGLHRLRGRFRHCAYGTGVFSPLGVVDRQHSGERRVQECKFAGPKTRTSDHRTPLRTIQAGAARLRSLQPLERRFETVAMAG